MAGLLPTRRVTYPYGGLSATQRVIWCYRQLLGSTITRLFKEGCAQLPGSQKLPANRFEPKPSAQALNNQTDWPVIFRITGPICARALKSKIQHRLGLRGHHDWPVMRVIRPVQGLDEHTRIIEHARKWLIAGPRPKCDPEGDCGRRRFRLLVRRLSNETANG